MAVSLWETPFDTPNNVSPIPPLGELLVVPSLSSSNLNMTDTSAKLVLLRPQNLPTRRPPQGQTKSLGDSGLNLPESTTCHASSASPWWTHHQADGASLTAEPGHNQGSLRHQQAHSSHSRVNHEGRGVSCLRSTGLKQHHAFSACLPWRLSLAWHQPFCVDWGPEQMAPSPRELPS